MNIISEMWNKIWCPECKTPNWICLGDLDDCTVPDIEAVKCFKCQHKIVLIDISDFYAYALEGDEDTPPMTEVQILEDLIYCENGREKPNC